MNTLRIGSTGEDVERWQFFLRGVGLYFGAVDGIFGQRTVEAIRRAKASCSARATSS